MHEALIPNKNTKNSHRRTCFVLRVGDLPLNELVPEEVEREGPNQPIF